MKKLFFVLITILGLSCFLNAQSFQNLFPDVNDENQWNSSKQHHLELLNSSNQLKSANELVFLLDSIHGYSINTESVWEGTYKIELTYDDRGNLIGYLGKDWNDDAADFLMGYNLVWIYDENNNEADYYFMSWNVTSTAWDTTSHYSYSYDEIGNQMGEVRKDWDAETSSWINVFSRAFKYDANGYVIEQLVQNWNAVDLWFDNALYTYENNADGLVTEFLMKSWNTTDSELKDKFWNFFKYDDNNNLIETDSKIWDENLEIWKNSYLSTFTYETNGLKIEQLSQSWNASNSVYDNITRYLFVYDEFGNETEYHSQNWDAGTSTWKQSRKDINYYSQHDVTEVEILELANSIIIYPNPAENEISLSNITELSTVSIHDINGKLFIQREVDSKKTVISVSQLPRGLYLLKISSQSGQQVAKFVKK